MSPGLVIREAKPEDYSIYAALFPELDTGDPVPSREIWLRECVSHTLIAEHHDAAVGFLRWQLLGGIGYVYQLVSAPQARRRGVGRELMHTVARLLREQNAETWCLNVKPDNEAALTLYQGLGLRFQYEAVSVRFPWSMVAEFPTAEVAVSEIREDEDEALEQTFGLIRGRIGDRRKTGRLLRMARSGDVPVGIALFSPGFPGAFPFRVKRPEVARPLLEALHPHADPSFDYMQVVIEDDPATADMLLGAGGTERLRFHHLHGPVPAIG